MSSRATLGAILPLHDVRYRAFVLHLGAVRPWHSDGYGMIFSADEANPGWWSQTGSNRRPPACKAGALPTELWPRRTGLPVEARSNSPGFALRATPGSLRSASERRLVGLGRFELPTSRLSSARSNQLSYKPVILMTGRSRATGAQNGTGLVREEREKKTAVSRLWTKSS